MPPDVWDSLTDELRKKLAEFIKANSQAGIELTADELRALILRAATPNAVVISSDYEAGEDIPLGYYRDALTILDEADWATARILQMEAQDAERARELWNKVLKFAADLGGQALMTLGKVAADRAIKMLGDDD